MLGTFRAKRWTGPAAALAMMAVAGAAAGAARRQPVLDLEGWRFVGASDTTLMFIKPDADAAGGSPRRVLVRFEEATPFDRGNFASMSNIEVDQVDCARQMTQVVRNTRYLEPNLKGESRTDVPDMPAWKPEAKGSFGEAILKAVCGETV